MAAEKYSLSPIDANDSMNVLNASQSLYWVVERSATISGADVDDVRRYSSLPRQHVPLDAEKYRTPLWLWSFDTLLTNPEYDDPAI